jgi:hypothetical protein
MPDVVVTAEILRRLLAEGQAEGHFHTLLHLDATAGLHPRPPASEIPSVQEGLFELGPAAGGDEG